MTDAILIDMFLDGDSAAFNHLVRKWQTPLYNFICRFVGDESDSADISQSVFLKAYRNLHRLQNRERFKSWLFQIAANHCRDHLRSRRFQAGIGDSDDSNPDEYVVIPVDSGMGPGDSVFSEDASHLLNRALQSLPEEQRLIIVLKEYHGLRFREIAAILQESENTIKSRMYHGLKNVKSILQKWGVNKEDLIYEM